MQATIQEHEHGVYAVHGELNMQTVPAVSKQLVQLMPDIKGNCFTLDFSAISRSDSAGVALLVEVMQLAKTANLNLSFANLPQQMKDIAEVSGLLAVLPLDKTF